MFSMWRLLLLCLGVVAGLRADSSYIPGADEILAAKKSAVDFVHALRREWRERKSGRSSPSVPPTKPPLHLMVAESTWDGWSNSLAFC